MKKTKIVCTIGPASEQIEVLEQLAQAGMNVCRLNFSHGTHDEHRRKIETIKELRSKLQLPLAIALDTKGPEIRLGTFENGPIELAAGDYLTLTTQSVPGTKERVSVTYKGLPSDVRAGSHILIDDGQVELVVEEIRNSTDVVCRAINYGCLSDRKGINIPQTNLRLPAITEIDFADILFGIEQGIDYIFASFIRKAADIFQIRRILEENGGGYIQIFAKIESGQGVQNLDEILSAADGIMVARGDLGVEIPAEEVPLWQKEIIRKANLAGKPVIIATQMLDSMTRNPRPTRAEVTDVANAILDGADAIMLSAETAAGHYPVESVRQMSRIADATESSVDFVKSIVNREAWPVENPASAIALSACRIASALKAQAIIAATASGFTSRLISKYRPNTPIIAVTLSDRIARQLAICWGVYPALAEELKHTDQLIDRSIQTALATGLVQAGDQVVITAGIPVGTGQETNMIKTHTIGLRASGNGAGHSLGSPGESRNPAIPTSW